MGDMDKTSVRKKDALEYHSGERPGKIDISNVMFYSEALSRPVRVGIKELEDGRKVRVALGRQGNDAPRRAGSAGLGP